MVAYTNQKVGILKPEDVREYAVKSEELILSKVVKTDLELSRKTLSLEEKEGKWNLFHNPSNKILRSFDTKKQAQAFYEAMIL